MNKLGYSGGVATAVRRQGAFADPSQLTRSWYVVARSRQVHTNQPRTWDVLDRRITLWRPKAGAIAAVDARCPHLGADLGQGTIVGDALQCAFHHWRFDSGGRCVEAPDEPELPDRCARRYPVRESHGLVWIYNGDAPAFELPIPPAGDDRKPWRRWIPPAQNFSCHPHLIIGNGMDARHFSSLHNMDVSEPPWIEELDTYRLKLHLRGRPSNKWMRRLIGASRQEVVASFTTVGSNIAWATVEQPLRMHVLFTARLEAAGRATTQTVFYLPRGLGLLEARAVLLMMSLLHADRRILERLDFHRGFTPADEPLRRFVQMVDAMEVEP